MASSLVSASRLSRPLLASTPRLLNRTQFASTRARYFTTALESEKNGLILKSKAAGKESRTRLSEIWLRDNCRCESCVNQDTMQRNFNTFEIAENIAPEKISPNENGVEILWSDSHKSSYTWSWLQSSMYGPANKSLRHVESGKKLWNSSVASSPPEVSFASVMDKSNRKGMADLTQRLHEFGLCFVVDTPVTPEATNELLETIGPVRNTHYGGFYDFVPDLAKADTAYTNLALAAHTDTTYFTEPAGLQAFHMLSHTPPPNQPEGESLGGQSLLVDGFYAAHRMRKEFPEDFETLRKVRVPWHASGNQGVAIAPDRAYPVIEASTTKLHRVRWNNDDRGMIPLNVNVDDWYRAARRWDSILRRKQNEFWFQLQPGRVLIFDNWRVLHGRSAFEGLRRICGGYINRDDFVSRWKTSNFPSEEVIAANMQLR